MAGLGKQLNRKLMSGESIFYFSYVRLSSGEGGFLPVEGCLLGGKCGVDGVNGSLMVVELGSQFVTVGHSGDWE